MPRVCKFTGKRTAVGNTYVRRGQPKYLGGIGLKVRGKSKRRFRPNIQTVNAVMPDGSVQRVKASTKAIRSGFVVKPLKRRYAYKPQQDAAPQA